MPKQSKSVMRRPSFLSYTTNHGEEDTALPLNTSIEQDNMTPKRRSSIEQVSIETPIRAST